jgi:hypothetical protein
MFACAAAQANITIIITDIIFIKLFKKYVLMKIVLNIILNNYDE